MPKGIYIKSTRHKRKLSEAIKRYHRFHPSRRSLTSIACSHCGKKTLLETWYVKKRIELGAKRFFCNSKCFYAVSGDGHFNWKGGYKSFYERHRGDIILESKKRYWKNRGSILRKIKLYASRNKKRISEYQKSYRPKANKDRFMRYHTDVGYKIKRNTDNHKRRKLLLSDGLFTIKNIQSIYEENIKRYKTLTCEYCVKPIVFGQDSIDHKIPISRGGGNNKENLCVACKSCNSRKNNKTNIEFMEVARE